MSEGARKARLNEKRSDWSARRLDDDRRARREVRLVEHAEPVEARADHPAQVVVDEDLVLHVGAAFRAAVAARRQRQVEAVVAGVAAEADDLARADRDDVAVLGIERLGVEEEGNRLAVGAERQQRVGVAIEDVGEDVELLRALGPLGRAVGQLGAAVHVERADAGVDDALGAGEAARERQPVGALGRVVVDARIELRLTGAAVGEERIRRLLGVVDQALGARQRVLRQGAGRDLVGPAVVHGSGMRAR